MNTSEMPSATISDLDKKRDLLKKLIQDKGRQAERAAPMSKGQESLWYVHQNAPKSAAYNVASAMRVYSPINKEHLQAALNVCIDRHPTLRTRYVVENGESKQLMQDRLKIRIHSVDASLIETDELHRLITRDYLQPFDLNCVPLIRLYVYDLGREESVVMLVVHHIVIDVHSLWILMDELGEIYHALVMGRSVTLQSKSQSYEAFVRKQNALLASENGREILSYWLQKLNGAHQPLTLDIAKRRPKLQAYHGKSYYFQLPKDMSQKIRKYSMARGVTTNTVLLAAYYCLLYRHSGQDDISVVSPTAGRNDPGFARTIGYFVNLIILRCHISGELTFSELLKQVHTTVLEGITYQDYPFSSLIEKLNPQRNSSYTPFAQCSFVFQKPREDISLSQAWVPGKDGPKVNWAGLEVSQYPLNQQEGQFELEIEAIETHGQIYGIIKYNSELFTEDSIRMLAGHYTTILDDVLKRDDCPVATLKLLTEDEEHQFESWNNTAKNYGDQNLLHRLIENQVRNTPSRTAVSFLGKELSYAEINSLANKLARHLVDRGVRPDDKVAVCMNRSIEMVVSLLAIIKAGGAYVPVDPNYPQARVAFLLEDAASPLLLTQSDLIDSLPSVTAHIVAVDILDLSRYSPENLDIDIQGHNLAYMIYTSGSTGQPKGAMNTHEGISNRLLWMQEAYQLTGEDVVLQKTPFSFDVSVWEFFWPLIVGAKLCVAKPEGHKDTRYLIETICTNKVTTLHFVPSMLSLFIAEKEASKCNSIRRVICSGESLSYDLQARFFSKMNCELHNLYGPTEAAVDVTFWQCRNDYEQPVVPIGKPISNIRIHILDKYMQKVPIGVCGELHIGGVGLARGYYKREQLTAEKFVPDPFSSDSRSRLYKTGDLVRYLPDGNIEYLQRIDNQIKLRGFRIELGEIEAVLRRCEGVRDAVVTKQDNAQGEGYLVAYLTKDAEDLSQEKVIDFAKIELPEHCVPRAVVMMDAIPLSPNGKVNAKLLPVHSFESAMVETAVPPRNDCERKLLDLWRKILGMEIISVTDNFFDIGGHSLLAVQLMAEIEGQFGKKLPLSSLIQNSTIEAIAELLEGNEHENWNNLVPIRAQGNKTAMFFIPGGGGNVLYYYPVANRMDKAHPFFAIQAQGLDGKSTPHRTVRAWAESAVDSILQTCPDGPFIIGGHCVGGLIANEVAQQLVAKGKVVEHLIILDAPAPHHFIEREIALTSSQWITILIKTISHMIGKVLDLDETHLDGNDELVQLELLKAKLVGIKMIPAATPLSQIEGLLNVFVANAQLHYEKPEKVYPIRISLLRAKEFNANYDYRMFDDDASIDKSTLGWHLYAREKIKVALVPGDHITMLSSANATELAECLTEILDDPEINPAQG